MKDHFGEVYVQKCSRAKMNLDVASLYDYTKIKIPLEVIHGKVSGPTLFISGAIHGDEINGVEIIKRLLQKIQPEDIHGRILGVPIVNVFGFNTKSRYLPDRRDLNRSFPGSKKGPLASRLASIFMEEIVKKSDFGIDFHTGAIHRSNLPQIRVNFENKKALEMAETFGAPAILHSFIKDGSLREACDDLGIPTLLFEGGEALRFDEEVIELAVEGCLRVMKSLKMIDKSSPLYPQIDLKKRKLQYGQESQWVRAHHSGSFTTQKNLGDWVKEGEQLAEISNPFGDLRKHVLAPFDGLIIGCSKIPLVNRGDAMFHLLKPSS